jgi:hypothetical protein
MKAKATNYNVTLIQNLIVPLFGKHVNDHLSSKSFQSLDQFRKQPDTELITADSMHLGMVTSRFCYELTNSQLSQISLLADRTTTMPSPPSSRMSIWPKVVSSTLFYILCLLLYQARTFLFQINWKNAHL